MTIHIDLSSCAGVPRGIGELLNFSAVDSAVDGMVSIAVAVALNDGSKHTFMIRLPADRAKAYADKLNHAVNAALRFAPRRAG